MKAISILGSTGSIGCNTLKVVEHLRDHRVVALGSGRNVAILAEQIAKFKPELVSVADDTVQAYKRVLEKGSLVLDTKNEPKLPERIQEVFALAKDLKTPENDKDKPLPGSDRLTYASVFQLAEIQTLLVEWKKLKEKLEPAAKSDKRS